MLLGNGVDSVKEQSVEAGGAWVIGYSRHRKLASKLRKEIQMSTAAANKGSWFLKALGIVTLIGVLIAIGRIVMKVFNEELEPEDEHGV
jgi:hypothetical protein